MEPFGILPDSASVLPGFVLLQNWSEFCRTAWHMKMLFSTRDPSEINSLCQELSRAGIRCRVRLNRIAKGTFGIPPLPELWIQRDSDILKALKKLGTRRLRDMTVIFSKPLV